MSIYLNTLIEGCKNSWIAMEMVDIDSKILNLY